MLDVVGAGGQPQRLLGGLVGVEGALVVLARRLVELGGQHVGVEPLQLLAEAGDVLVGDDAHSGEVGGLTGLELGAAALRGDALEDEDAGADDQEQHEDVHVPSLRGAAHRFRVAGLYHRIWSKAGTKRRVSAIIISHLQ